MGRPVLILIAVLAVFILEVSCYRIIRPTYRTPRTRRPIIRRARDVEFVKTIGEAKELYNEDEGMFTDRPYFYEEENHNGTPLKKEHLSDIAHGDKISGYNGDQDRIPGKETISTDTGHGHGDSSYNGPNTNIEENSDHLERSVRSANTVGAKRVKGRPGDKNPRSKWSKIVHPDYVTRHTRAVGFGTHVPKPVYYNPLNPRTWRKIGIPSPIIVNRNRPYNI